MPVRGVNSEEVGFVGELKRLNVLQRTKFCSTEPTHEVPICAAVMCGDGHLLVRKLKSHGRIIGELLHPITLIGGAMAFSPKSPLNNGAGFPIGFFVNQAKLIQVAKGTTKLHMYSHLPCGAATHFKITIPQMIELSLIGAGTAREQLTVYGYKVAVYLHVYYGESRQFDPKIDETFEIDIAAWLDARDRYREELMALPQTLVQFATV